MNKKWMAATLLASVVFFQATAQSANGSVKETKKAKKDETIIVKKKAGSKEKLTIMVDGESVTVNGKPIEEFSDENVEIIRNKNAQGYTVVRSPRYGLTMPQAYSVGGTHIAEFPMTSTMTANKAVLGVMTDNDDKGAKITSITRNSAASKAGLKECDIITKINDQAIANSDELYKAIGKFKPEDKITITYLRDGKANTTSATLLKSREAFGYSWGSDYTNFAWGRPRVGLQVQDVEEGNGVTVLDVDDETPAAKAGLKENDVITQIDGKELKNVDEFKTKIRELKEGDSVKLTYKREGNTQTTELKIPKKLKTATL